MTINNSVLKGDLNGKIVVVRFFFCWVYINVTFPLHFAGKKINIHVYEKKCLTIAIPIPAAIPINMLIFS